MAWVVLVVAGLFEVGWAIGLKYTDGFSRVGPSILTVLSIVASMGLLAVSLKTLPVGIAYPIWTGIGTVGAAALGVILFKEVLSATQVLFLLMIVVGILGLKFSVK